MCTLYTGQVRISERDLYEDTYIVVCVSSYYYVCVLKLLATTGQVRISERDLDRLRAEAAGQSFTHYVCVCVCVCV